MPNENRSCKKFKQGAGISPDIFLGIIQPNCANCSFWNGKKCNDEKGAIAVGLLAEFGW